jgi:hypothetical protein
MSARLFGSKLLGVAPLAEFAIPPKYIPVILSSLTPAVQTDFSQADEWRYGEIKIETKQDRIILVTLYEGGDNPTCFSVDGVNYVRSGIYKPNSLYNGNNEHYLDESSWLYQIIKAVNQERLGASSDVQELIEELQRSHGERPPRRD